MFRYYTPPNLTEISWEVAGALIRVLRFHFVSFRIFYRNRLCIYIYLQNRWSPHGVRVLNV